MMSDMVYFINLLSLIKLSSRMESWTILIVIVVIQIITTIFFYLKVYYQERIKQKAILAEISKQTEKIELIRIQFSKELAQHNANLFRENTVFQLHQSEYVRRKYELLTILVELIDEWDYHYVPYILFIGTDMFKKNIQTFDGLLNEMRKTSSRLRFLIKEETYEEILDLRNAYSDWLKFCCLITRKNEQYAKNRKQEEAIAMSISRNEQKIEEIESKYPAMKTKVLISLQSEISHYQSMF